MFLLLFQLHTLSSLETGCGGCHQPGAAKACKMTGFIVDMYILLSNCLQTQRTIDSESSSRCFPLLALFGRKMLTQGCQRSGVCLRIVSCEVIETALRRALCEVLVVFELDT